LVYNLIIKGLFGFYFYGEKDCLKNIKYLCQEYFGSLVSNGIAEHEIEGAKNKIYLELLRRESQNEYVEHIGD